MTESQISLDKIKVVSYILLETFLPPNIFNSIDFLPTALYSSGGYQVDNK